MIGIHDLIIGELIEDIEDACQTYIATDDPTYVDTIKQGSLNSTPETTHGNHVCIYSCDYRNTDQWRDEAASMTRMQDYGAFRSTAGMEMAEIGGGVYWWRRFLIQITCQYTQLGYDQDESREYASQVIQRVRQALRDNRVTGTDDFGETVTDVYSKVRWEEHQESGAGTQWIWRQYIGVEILTSVT